MLVSDGVLASTRGDLSDTEWKDLAASRAEHERRTLVQGMGSWTCGVLTPAPDTLWTSEAPTHSPGLVPAGSAWAVLGMGRWLRRAETAVLTREELGRRRHGLLLLILLK